MGQDYKQFLSRIDKVIEEYDDFLNLLYENRLELYNDFKDYSIHRAFVYNLMVLLVSCEGSNNAQRDFFNYYVSSYTTAEEAYYVLLSDKSFLLNLKQEYSHHFSIEEYKAGSISNFWLGMLVYSRLYTDKNIFEKIVVPYCEILFSIFEGVNNSLYEDYIIALPNSFLAFLNAFNEINEDKDDEKVK